MDLIAFRVRMYKGIIDSGWVDVNNLTVLVGKNESGKTSLLKALHKLNPYNPEPYNMTNEWPRGRREERSEDHVVCRAKFRLSNQEAVDLLQTTGLEMVPDTVEVSRDYAGHLDINFGEEISLDISPSVDIDAILEVLPEVRDDFSGPFKKCANDCLEEVRRFVNESPPIGLKRLIQKHTSLLRDNRIRPHNPSYDMEGRFINQYPDCLNQLIQDLQQSGTPQSPQSEVHKYITEHLPTFVYMDDYRAFSGNAHLEDIQSRDSEKRLTEADKTFLTILHLSNLKLDKLVTFGQGNEEQIEQRQYDLADGADALTKIILNQFPDRRYEVEYRVDGQNFFTYVKNRPDSPLIRLEEKSKGFQWLFSFDLMLMRETEGSLKGCVILLDEPGLHLHPDAQKNLLARLEEYANGNTLLYTTHLPFMIDLNHPERIRILKEVDNKIVVTTDLVESSAEARFVLQAAFGMDASHSLLIADRNLVVEGVHDYYVLAGLSNLLKRSGKDGLLEDVRITPGPSASEAVHIAALMIGQNLDVVVLFDSDDAGRKSHDKLLKTWLTGYTEKHTKVLLLGDVVGVERDFELEDLFSEDFMKEIVKETYSKELTNAGVDEIVLEGEGMIWDRIESFMKKHNINKIHKGSIAKRLRDRLNKMKDINDLPEETTEKAIKLFQTIREALGEGETEPS